MFFIFLKKSPFSIIFTLVSVFTVTFFIMDMLATYNIADNIIPVLFYSFLTYIGIAILYANYVESKIEHYVTIRKKSMRKYQFPLALSNKVLTKYPHLYPEQVEEILLMLKKYFFLYLDHYEVMDNETFILRNKHYKHCFITDKEKKIMPSKAIDFAWQAFYEMKDDYQQFCKIHLKCHLEYFDACPISVEEQSEKLIAIDWHLFADHPDLFSETWFIACKTEKIDPLFPEYLPTLFSLDERLDIPSGFCYDLNKRLIFGNYIHIKHAPTPSELVKEINQKIPPIESSDLTEKKRQKNISYLGRRLLFYTNKYDYCHRFQKDEIARLFNEITRRNELVTYMFGDYALLVKQKDHADKAALPPPDAGCSSGAAV